jgi:DNA (cytosine-5)-methyltransferase 1
MTREIIVDSFAGGGGASLGIARGAGRRIDIAINHDREAIAMHAANHPETRHFCEDVFAVHPVKATGGLPVGLAWFSPDCKHFSRAKGGKPADKKIRGLAWVVIRWARLKRPRTIFLENVEEFEDWGPLGPDDRPDPKRVGLTFRRWVGQLRNLGYTVEWRALRAADYGAPTSRKRLFLIARCDGLPIVWPDLTHGTGREPYRTAAACIDWALPCPSIFGRRRPLADKTLKRIAAGIRKFVLEAETPFVVPIDGALASPTLIQRSWGERPGQAPRVPGLEKPLGTVVSGGIKHALVAAFLAKHYGGHTTPGASLEAPFSTVTARDHHALVHAFLLKYFGTATGQSPADPLHTVTSKARFGLVMVRGEPYEIADIGMRMLTPRELYRAQGFPDDYVIDPVVGARRLSKTSQIRMAGNSVCPDVAEALVRANYGAVEAREVA